MEESTHYAPGLRSTSNQIHSENEFVASQRLFIDLFSAVSGISAVLDNNRQVVYVNKELLTFLDIQTMEHILGKRFGEVISCIHSAEEAAGCGTSEACTYCGAVNAILESQKSGLKSTRECRISTLVDGKYKSWDLNITSSPISLSGNNYYIFSIQDISHEKRRLSLERIFFHDLLNSAGGLNGLLTILKDGNSPEDTQELINLSEEASRDILEEIIVQKQIREAETGDLQVKIEHINSIDLLYSCIGKIKSHNVGQDKEVCIDSKAASIDFETDRILLQRVIINLIKNALEATQQKGFVVAGVKEELDKVIFWIKNNGVMPDDVQKQLFQRSFSTKGQGRGTGTYSIKLLTENYLKGIVSFVSNETEGTVFNIELKKSLSPD